MGVLRVLLAFCVFCAHTRNVTPLVLLPGDSAVEAFFLISGFYMQLVLTRRYSRATLGRHWVLRFYASRFLRLYPSYLLITAAMAAATVLGLSLQPWLVWQTLHQLPPSISNITLSCFMMATNVFMILQDITMYLGVSHNQAHFMTDFQLSEVPLWQGLAVPQAWSLGIELSFYVLAPLLLRLRSGPLALVGILLLGAKLTTLHITGLGDPFTYRFLPFELPFFFAGALAFRFRRRFELSAAPVPIRLASCAVIVAFVVCGLGFNIANPNVRLAALTLGLPLLFSATSSSNVDRSIGELSYPFYISHWLALSVTNGVVNTWTALGATLIVSVLLLAIEQELVEPWRERIAGTTREPRARSGDLRRAFLGRS